jgi:glycosyltransferase involved in cell wall biosynthesis
VYNAEDTIQTALGSVLSQTWTNLEVLVVDDCSTDATVPIVESYVRRDSRVQLIRTNSNGGTYVARNHGLRVATGSFVTCHDADDWSHPEKIEKQARHLLSNPLVIGNISQAAFATSDLKFNSKGRAKYSINNTSSLMFRREPVMDAVGYWDCVRFSADTEFLRRVKKVFGDESVGIGPEGPVLSFVRQSSSSLTSCNAFGYYGVRRRGARKEYHEGYTRFHDTAENLRYEFPQHDRPFAVPEPMWPRREAKRGERRHFDVILVSDFRLTGDTTSSNIEQIKAQKQRCPRTDGSSLFPT